MKRAIAFVGLLLWLLAFVGGCSSPRATAALAVRRPMLVDSMLHAGVARIDITPPIHMSLYGHGPESRIAVGTRLRLRCTAFVLADGTNDPIALVPCELGQPALVLQRSVVARLRQLGIPIRIERLLISATHTHAGPAHYFDSPFLSGPFSSSAVGFDPEVLDFLASRIADGLAEAFTRLEPACAGWGTTEVEDPLTINRAYEAFLDNVDASLLKRVEHPAGGPGPRFSPDQALLIDAARPALNGDPRTRAVDRHAFALRIDRRAPRSEVCNTNADIIGAFAVFGMHNTGVDHANDLFHGDIFGFAARDLEACLKQAAPDPENLGHLLPIDDVHACEYGRHDWTRGPVVGIANGIEGDVSPAVNLQGFDAARRHGRRLAKALYNTIASAIPRANPTISMRYWELWFPAGQWGPHHGDVLCRTPQIGIAAGGGAQDGPTRLRVAPEANAGYRLPPVDARRLCQGEKLILRSSLMAADEYLFPTNGPIALIRIGDGYIASAPGELTTMTGLRVRRAIQSVLEPEALGDRPLVAVVGLTNSYLEYFATEAEYRHQLYEGASTLYGPHSSEFLVRHFRCLAHGLTGTADAPNETCPRQLEMDRYQSFQPTGAPVVSRFTPDDPTYRWRGLQGADFKEVPIRGIWDLEIPALPAHDTADRTSFNLSVVDEWGNVVDDDRGASFEVRENRDGTKWHIRWVPDIRLTPEPGIAPDTRCGKTFRIRIGGRVNLESGPLTIRCGV